MTNIEEMFDLIENGGLVAWELRQGSGVIGKLVANGWIDTPFFGCDFQASEHSKNYGTLDQADLTLSPITNNALPGSVERITINGSEAQLIVNFEEPANHES